MDTYEAFNHGDFFTLTGSKALAACAWSEHKSFAGVFLKDILTLEEGDGRFSLHLVRLNPGAIIGLHTHPNSIELHEVIAGTGICQLENRELDYRPGNLALIACGLEHEVRAGAGGLCLFAKFITV